MPTVRFEPTTFAAAAGNQSGPATQSIAASGTPVNYTPTGASAKGFGPVTTRTAVVVKAYGGGVYINHGPDTALPTAGPLTAGSRHLPAGGYQVVNLAPGDSIAVITGEIT